MSRRIIAMRLRLIELTILVLWTLTGVSIAIDTTPTAPSLAPVSPAASQVVAPAPSSTSTVAVPTAPVAAPATPAPTTSPDEKRATAVTLNYCRASFHRIRKEPTREVLFQEQEKILNNLNMDAVADPEVIQLYTSVLDEINQVGVADFERNLYREQHKNAIQKKLAWDVLALGADVATAQLGTAIRSGANSWWDYRAMTFQREQDLLKIEKARINSVVAKSTQFMDTFWKLAQKKKIPDKWLVRGSDLDSLELAMREPNPEIRLRVLRRMEDFMTCYPPYWYYLGRTQQEQGQLQDAVVTYQQLEKLGQGHFRKDDMIATALANQAAIEDYNGQLTACSTAGRALSYSRDVWEANLVCARVLERSQRTTQAEDAILCNLDTNMETRNSRVFLVSLYQKSGDTVKLGKTLSEPQAIAELPAPLLLRCAATLGEHATPPAIYPAILASLDAQPQFQFGKDELVLRVSPAWQLHLASMQVFQGDQSLGKPAITAMNGFHQLRFAGKGNWGAPFESPRDLNFTVQLNYPDQTIVKLSLRPDPTSGSSTAARPLFTRTASGVATTTTMRIADVQIGEQKIALGNLARAVSPSAPTRVETAKPAFPSPTTQHEDEEEVLPPIDATGGRVRTSQVDP